MIDSGVRVADKYDSMDENKLRDSARQLEERLKQSIDKYESKQKTFEETQSELVAVKDEMRHANDIIYESKKQIQQLEFERNNLKQELFDIRAFEIEIANTRIINDRLLFENDRLDRYILHLIDSHSQHSIMERPV